MAELQAAPKGSTELKPWGLIETKIKTQGIKRGTAGVREYQGTFISKGNLKSDDQQQSKFLHNCSHSKENRH